MKVIEEENVGYVLKALASHESIKNVGCVKKYVKMWDICS
jgi:hypothetical protein